MNSINISKTLKQLYPDELVDLVLNNYENALNEYRKSHWQYFGNEIGQFIEVVRRIVEYCLEGKYTPLTNKLPIFNERVLIEWENKAHAYSEVYRIIIPRCLYSMYCLRNKRGMIHKNHIDPNKMDATVLLNNAKWVLSELFRLASNLSFDETEEIIESIINKELPIIWDTGKFLRILDAKMPAKEKVICLLYIKNRQSEDELRASTEYKNGTHFKNILKALHKDKIIEYSVDECILSPIGIDVAEKILSK